MTRPGAFPHDQDEWDAWEPEEVARLLEGVDAPWYVAAGWALELFRSGRHRKARGSRDRRAGRPLRRVEALPGLEIFVMGPEQGIATPLEQAGDLLEPTHQTWVREPEPGVWRFDIFREPSDGDTWICRRDERIRMPCARVIEHTADGIPYGRPEIVLLYKAKHTRPKDDADFAAVLPLLEPERRRWLADSLELVHPGHRWLAAILDRSV